MAKKEQPAPKARKAKAAEAPKPAPAPSAGHASLEVIAKLLMLTPQRVSQLVKEGFIPRAARNAYPIAGAVQGYIRFLKDEERRTSKSASASRVQDARAREIEIRVAREEGRIADLDEVNAVVADVLGTYRAELSGVAAGATRDLEIRAAIERLQNDAIERARQSFARQVAALRDGRSVSVDDEA